MRRRELLIRMMLTPRDVLAPVTVLAIFLMLGCTDNDRLPTPPTGPTGPVTANAYILPGAVALGDHAFGDEPIVVYKSERLHWVNTDTLTHDVVADSPSATDFRRTDQLPLGGEQSFIMTKLGTTRIHCAIHPNMTGTLIVRNH
jgi:hypothetical protein